MMILMPSEMNVLWFFNVFISVYNLLAKFQFVKENKVDFLNDISNNGRTTYYKKFLGRDVS